MPSGAAYRNESALVRRSVANLTSEQAKLLLAFFEELLSISRMPIPRGARFRRVIRLLLGLRKSLSAILKALINRLWTAARETPSWRPSVTMKFMLGGAVAGAAAFGAQSAGLAAMGTAIAVPLWLVTSAGSTMLGVLLDELRRKAGRTDTPPAATNLDGGAARNVVRFPFRSQESPKIAHARRENVLPSGEALRSA